MFAVLVIVRSPELIGVRKPSVQIEIYARAAGIGAGGGGVTGGVGGVGVTGGLGVTGGGSTGSIGGFGSRGSIGGLGTTGEIGGVACRQITVVETVHFEVPGPLLASSLYVVCVVTVNVFVPLPTVTASPLSVARE